jgi:hypothetical protein
VGLLGGLATYCLWTGWCARCSQPVIADGWSLRQVRSKIWRPARASGGGRGGELPLILVIHRHRLAEHGHRLDAGHPIEVVVQQERVVALERGQVMPVGVAVSLREQRAASSALISRRGVGVLQDVVVEGVDDFAGVDAAGVVPDEPIVDRASSQLRAGRKSSRPRSSASSSSSSDGSWPLKAKRARWRCRRRCCRRCRCRWSGWRRPPRPRCRASCRGR